MAVPLNANQKVFRSGVDVDAVGVLAPEGSEPGEKLADERVLLRKLIDIRGRCSGRSHRWKR